MMPAQPTVSIVVCTYNGARFLAQQLDTLVAQTYPILEIVVQDDGSTDGTWEILERYAAHHPHIRPLRNGGEHGVNPNFLSALRRAKGDLVAVCDQDDLWEADKIELQVRALMAEAERGGSALYCTCHSEQFGADGTAMPFDSRVPNLHPVRLMFRSIPGHTVLMRRTLVEALPRDNEIYRVSFYDVAFALAAAALGGCPAFVDKVLVRQRRYEAAASFSALATQRTTATAGNGLFILRWSLQNYRRVRPHVERLFRSREAFLRALPAGGAPERAEMLRLCRLQQQRGPAAYVRLTAFCLRHRRHLFQTEGHGALNFARALLFPLMQAWNFRGWVEK